MTDQIPTSSGLAAADTVRLPAVPIAASADTPAPVLTKPGYQTTEFWLSALAMILGVVMASGAVPNGGIAAQVIGGLLSVLASLGYTASRTKVKTGGEA